MQRDERRCAYCHGDQFVEDRSAGDLVCRQCGLVAEAHLIDERSEWRTFSDKDKEGADPNRVGGPTNHLLGDAGISTTIGKLQKGDDGGLSSSLNRLQARTNNAERQLITAFKAISRMCDTLNLTDAIKKRSQEIYSEVYRYKQSQVKACGASAIYLACIAMACRQEGHPRTFKELQQAAEDAKKKEIGRCFKVILAMYQEKQKDKQGAGGTVLGIKMTTSYPAYFMAKYVSELSGWNERDKMACRTIATKAQELNENKPVKWQGKPPKTVAAAIVFIVAHLRRKDLNEKVDMQEIVLVTDVTDNTIRSCYQALKTEIENLVPPTYASKADLEAKLPQ